MKEDLKKQAKELEQTLSMQLNFVKQESGDWAKVGGVVLVTGLATFFAIRTMGKKRNKKTDKVILALEREGLLDDEIREKLMAKKPTGFFGRIGALAMPMILDFGKQQFLNRIMEPDKVIHVKEK